MEKLKHLPSGGIELTIESEAYLELAKDDLLKYEYEDARKELEVAVRSANPQAEYLLGWLYDHALGVDRDEEKALLWYLRAAEHGYAPAQTAAASLYICGVIDGHGVPANYAEAYRLLTLAVQKEDADAGYLPERMPADFPHAGEYQEEDDDRMAAHKGYADYLLGWMYAGGLHVETDYDKAVCWIEKAAQKGYWAAIFDLANRPQYGIHVNEIWARKAVEFGEYYPLINVAQRYIDGNATPQDIEKGIAMLTELADNGAGSAQIALAERLITGKGVPKDTDKALHYIALATETGHMKLIAGLGISLYTGEGNIIDSALAVKCLELTARAGHVDALVELGNLYLDGAGDMPPDQEKAFAYFIQAAQMDNPRGWELTGYCLYEGKGTPQNRQEALRWYEKAAEKNLYNSYYMMGMIYGYDEELFNYEKAVSCFEKSAKLGQTDALVRLGTIHLNGVRATPPDREKAYRYFIQAVKADNALGCEWAAYCQYYGYGTPQNTQKALQLYQKAAQKGLRHSQYMLGYIYGYGLTTPDYKKAAHWFRKAAEQGHSDAQLKLGFYYHHGRGVKQDYKKAFTLFAQAAANGHATAMYNLGDAFENGHGVEKDEKQALDWYSKSAELGDKWGMFGVGRLLYDGIGTAQNQEEGRRWICQAAEAGLQDAIDWRP